MSQKAAVAIVKCDSYDEKQVSRAVNTGIKLLGGIESIFRGKRQALLKPNILLGIDPDQGATTHPSVFTAVARFLKQSGFNLSYGDTPGFGTIESVCKKSGIGHAAKQLNIPRAEFKKGREVVFEQGIQNKIFYIAEGILKSECIVNIPKMKTHGLTTMTGAIKNMFGVIPGLRKAAFHARLQDLEAFSRMLIDLNRFLTPTLHIMDAVYGMEGNGPSHGDLVHTGLLLFSQDPVAIDATACRIMGINPMRLYFLKYGEQIGLGSMRADEINIKGVPLKECTVRKYKLPPPRKWEKGIPFLQRLGRRHFIPRPVINNGVCTKCDICVKVCPVKPKALTREDKAVPVYNYKLCIRCYCCQEMCPAGAVTIKIPFLGRFFYGYSRRV
jgi:uncharacterized protein (DUF362 family)/Pyruvate/2-oxoacid:ferredoxin oxidoreductase delta subunit